MTGGTATPRPSIGADRPRLVVVDEVVLALPRDDRYLSLRALATYSGCSVRWLRDRLADPRHPLPHFRLPGGGKLLVRQSDWDHWLARYRQVGRADVTAVVVDVLSRVARSGARRRPRVP